jgi:hypothetical protein
MEQPVNQANKATRTSDWRVDDQKPHGEAYVGCQRDAAKPDCIYDTVKKIERPECERTPAVADMSRHRARSALLPSIISFWSYLSAQKPAIGTQASYKPMLSDPRHWCGIFDQGLQEFRPRRKNKRKRFISMWQVRSRVPISKLALGAELVSFDSMSF